MQGSGHSWASQFLAPTGPLRVMPTALRRFTIDYVMNSTNPNQGQSMPDNFLYLPRVLFGAAVARVALGFMVIVGEALSPGRISFLPSGTLTLPGILVADMARLIFLRQPAEETPPRGMP